MDEDDIQFMFPIDVADNHVISSYTTAAEMDASMMYPVLDSVSYYAYATNAAAQNAMPVHPSSNTTYTMSPPDHDLTMNATFMTTSGTAPLFNSDDPSPAVVLSMTAEEATSLVLESVFPDAMTFQQHAGSLLTTTPQYDQDMTSQQDPDSLLTMAPQCDQDNQSETPTTTTMSTSCCTSPTAATGPGYHGQTCTPLSPSSPSPSSSSSVVFQSQGAYPEIPQYPKDQQQQSTRRKRRYDGPSRSIDGSAQWDSNPSSSVSNSELRRQIHIQSEQKRRAQIKDGFEDLRNELPSCLNKKMSKVALLHKTVQHIQHLKNTQMTILAELERLVQENEQLRKFQEGVLRKQALEKMYYQM